MTTREALQAAIAAVANSGPGITRNLPEATTCFNFVRDHGPALLRALECEAALRQLVVAIDAPLGEPYTAQMIVAMDNARDAIGLSVPREGVK